MIRAKFLYYSLLYLESVFIKTLAIALLTRLATCTNFELCIVVESSHKQHNTTLTKNMSYVEPIVEAAIIEATEEIVAAISEDAMEISECTAGNSKKGENRNVFPKISKDVIVKGVVVKTHPFLEGKCESELIFVKLLAVEKPFLAPHGSGKKTWADFIALVNQQVDENNAPVFAQAPMTERFAKERIKDYFSFVKSRIASTPFRSGTDDEEPPCELLQIVEDLYEQKTSFENDANDKKIWRSRIKKILMLSVQFHCLEKFRDLLPVTTMQLSFWISSQTLRHQTLHQWLWSIQIQVHEVVVCDPKDHQWIPYSF